MPKKQTRETTEQQAERFKRAVQDMINAGELNPTEADESFARLMGRVAVQRQRWFDGDEAPESHSQ
jgi:hypothetical protein